MPENRIPNPIEPEAIGKITYWKRQLHLLAEPGVILIIVGVAIISWNVSGWYSKGVIESQKAELSLSQKQLDATVAEANQAIVQMKELGLALAAPILDEMAADKLVMGGGDSLEENVEHLLNIDNRLKELGASTEQIDAMRLNMDRSVMRNLRRRIVAGLYAMNKDKEPVVRFLREKASGSSQWSEEEFERFIHENNLKITSEIDEDLVKLEYFSANRRFPEGR